MSGPHWISKSLLVKYMQGISRKARRKMKCDREKQKCICCMLEVKREVKFEVVEMWVKQFLEKMCQGICAQWRTQVGRKPQQATSQLPREGGTYPSVSGFWACWSTECHERKATTKTFKSSVPTTHWSPTPILLIPSFLSAFTCYSLVAGKTRL